jgi:WhiB family redox-sensing transcriptional regulator
VIDFLPTPAGWAKDAACTQSDPDAWFPSTGEGNARAAQEATRICRDVCPVREECLAAILAQAELPRYGIWAGFSVEQLRQMKAPARATKDVAA